jgi:hypothetical protein
MRFVAVVVLLLGLFTANSGLNILGSPLSLQNLGRNFFPSTNGSALAQGTSSVAANGDAVLYVQNSGYFPRTVSAPAGKDFVLNLVTQKTYSCARDFVIPSLNFYQLLPDTGTIPVSIPAQPKGTVMYFTCSMGMYTGQIVFQ